MPTTNRSTPLILGLILICAGAPGATEPIRLSVDARDSSQGMLHTTLAIPARPGPLTLLYPKWIPGEHGPTGPITDLAGLKLRAAGRPISWQRDAEDMYAFHLEVPTGAESVEAAFDFLLSAASEGASSGGSATARLLVLNWNQVLLYPQGTRAGELAIAARLRLPADWKYGTALPVSRESPDGLEFSPVSLETLVDSPLIAGAYFRTVELTPGARPPHFLDMVADSAEALGLKPGDQKHFSQLVAETGALFGARHYGAYHFLLTLSDHVAHFGLEHHESSDDRAAERSLIDPDALKRMAGLLPHEMAHSWNGKYRRPAGLVLPDYQQPMSGELLWVYEGLTTYLGDILTARCGLWTNATYREMLAYEAAVQDHRAGRSWRPLADTALAAQLLYEARPGGEAWRRGVDFYPEGALIWLEADVLIRQKTGGRRSLDDFCQSFCGGASGAPKVVSYTLEDVLSALNEVVAHDWRGFFQARVQEISLRAPLAGIEGSGWRLVYREEPSDWFKSVGSEDKQTDLRFSLGLTVKEKGELRDVIPGSPAAKAGIGPGMKLVAVNGRRWTPEVLRAAVKAAQTNSALLELLVENADFYTTCKLDYHGGERYPALERDLSKPDLLAEILKPRGAQPGL